MIEWRENNGNFVAYLDDGRNVGMVSQAPEGAMDAGLWSATFLTDDGGLWSIGQFPDAESAKTALVDGYLQYKTYDEWVLALVPS